jgi:hypothetical protein
MTPQETQSEYHKRWRLKNAELLKQRERERYQQNRERVLSYCRQKRLSKKQIKEARIVEVESPRPPPKREYKLFEILDILRKDLRHQLWGKCVKEWTEKDWFKFNELKNA